MRIPEPPSGFPVRKRRPRPLSAVAGYEGEPQMPSTDPTILVVDDQTPIRRILRAVLEALGYRVLVAEGGPAALRLASEHRGRLDLLLTDVSMPVMEGPELADRLAALRPDISVLYISGDRCFRPPSRTSPRVLGFLPKPFTPQELGERVGSFLPV